MADKADQYFAELDDAPAPPKVSASPRHQATSKADKYFADLDPEPAPPPQRVLSAPSPQPQPVVRTLPPLQMMPAHGAPVPQPAASHGPLSAAHARMFPVPAPTSTLQFSTTRQQEEATAIRQSEPLNLIRRLPFDAAKGVVRGAEGIYDAYMSMPNPDVPEPRDNIVEGNAVHNSLHGLGNAFEYMTTGKDPDNPSLPQDPNAPAPSKQFAEEHPVLSTIMGGGEGLASVAGQVMASGGSSVPLGLLAGGAKLAELKTKIKAEHPEMSDEAAQEQAMPSALTEGVLFGGMPGVGKMARAGVDKALAKIGVKELSTIKTMIKDVASTIAIDTPYMVGQGAAVSAVDKATGADEKVDPAEALSGKNLLVSGGTAALFAMLHARGTYKEAKEALAKEGVDLKDVTDPKDIHDILLTSGYTSEEIAQMHPELKKESEIQGMVAEAKGDD